jgi:glycerol-3-phosphate acyltransferase PlsY
MLLNDGLLHRYFYDAAAEKLSVDPLLYYGLLLGVLLVAYFLGSMNSAIVISKLVYRDDIRKYGSGNAGMTNMLRTYGKNAALLTLMGDLLKTVIALIIAAVVFGFHYMGGISIGGDLGECYLAGLFAVLGHIFPVYYKFKGGKGVLVSSTMALVLSPLPFLILLALFVIVVWISRYVSLGSVVVCTLYPVIMHGYFALYSRVMPAFTAISTIVIAIIIVWCHRTNLARIGNRTENKLSFGKKKDE